MSSLVIEYQVEGRKFNLYMKKLAQGAMADSSTARILSRLQYVGLLLCTFIFISGHGSKRRQSLGYFIEVDKVRRREGKYDVKVLIYVYMCV